MTYAYANGSLSTIVTPSGRHVADSGRHGHLSVAGTVTTEVSAHTCCLQEVDGEQQEQMDTRTLTEDEAAEIAYYEEGQRAQQERLTAPAPAPTPTLSLIHI